MMLCMESHLKKHFRTSGEDIKIRGYGSFTEVEIKEIKDDFTEYLTKSYSELQLRSLNLNAEFGEDINPKIEFVLNELISYFESLGVGPVSFNEFFVTNDGFNGAAGQAHVTSGITVSNPGLESIELKQIVFLKTLAHELYHSTAIASLTIKETFSENTFFRDVYIGGGASYDTKEEPLLLEEGLAARFEEQITPKIIELFSEDVASEYDEIVESALEILNEPELTDKFDVHIHQIKQGDEEGIGFTTSRYSGSKRVVKYLESEIKDFSILVENARLKRHTLPLARAIEERFGNGSYRRLTTTPATGADQVLSDLTR
jgi:hypothetical protein